MKEITTAELLDASADPTVQIITKPTSTDTVTLGAW
jgi:hypothetical protein